MKKIGSQTRELLSESGYTLHSKRGSGEVILTNIVDGKRELWAANNHYAGYVIEIDGMGYEFIRTLKGE
jgi:hypothetical protein